MLSGVPQPREERSWKENAEGKARASDPKEKARNRKQNKISRGSEKFIRRWDAPREKMMKNQKGEHAQAAHKDLCELMYKITNYMHPRN